MPIIPKSRARVALVALDLLAALAAIGGGLALTAGLEGARFPIDWLDGTPFDSYFIPGLILAGAVGGTALVAAAATLRSPEFGAWASVLAGVVLIGWIAGEIAILAADTEPVSPTECFFLPVGLAMAGLGLGMRRAEHS